MKRVKHNITAKEFRKLMNYLEQDFQIREHTRKNLKRVFNVLFHTGIRLNEIQELTIKNIKELVEDGKSVLYMRKVDREKILYCSKDLQKELIKLVDFDTESEDMKLVTKASVKSGMSGLNEKVLIGMVNDYLKKVLGVGYTSHSFRQGLLTEMASCGTNIKIMAQFAGHQNTQTTAKYIQATDEDMLKNLVR
jgi:integrase